MSKLNDKFPKPIELPETVVEARKTRNREIVSSARRGLLIRLFIIGAEFLGFFFFGSVALLADALSSFMDVISTFFLILFVKLAEKPPDDNHPFGHGRLEPLIGMQLGLFLLLLGGFLLFQQLFQMSHETSVEVIHPFVWLIPAMAVVLLEICYHIMIRTSKKQNSPALAADAIHYRMDALTSLLAAIALILGAYFPLLSLTFDHIGAIFIASTMVVVGGIAAWKNLNQLIDRKPPKEFFNRVKNAALKAEGVKETEKIKIQLYGPDAHVVIDVEVDPKLTVDRAHKISQNVRAEIQKEWPAVRDVIVHIEPFYTNDH